MKGSPPHMRGKEEEGELSARKDRITPAYAGKSSTAYSSLASPEDHPRICGEKSSKYFSAISAVGSPPHMRGKD